jgi:RimJ/RimL family protein N-acetyltransferase
MVIKTTRLCLRAHRAEDFERYLPLWTLPEPPDTPGYVLVSAEETWARLLRSIGHWTHFGYGFFVVEDLQTGDLVAEAGFAHFRRGVDPGLDSSPEAGWRVLRTRRQQGIASEAMQAALQWFDAQAAGNRTACMIHPDNEASLAVASRIGYRQFASAQYKERPVLLLERFAPAGRP